MKDHLHPMDLKKNPACDRFPNDIQNKVLPTSDLTTLSVAPNGQVQALWKQVMGSDKSFSSEKRKSVTRLWNSCPR